MSFFFPRVFSHSRVVGACSVARLGIGGELMIYQNNDNIKHPARTLPCTTRTCKIVAGHRCCCNLPPICAIILFHQEELFFVLRRDESHIAWYCVRFFCFTARHYFTAISYSESVCVQQKRGALTLFPRALAALPRTLP